MKCKICNLEIGWFEDYLDCKWFGCECEAKLSKEEYEESQNLTI